MRLILILFKLNRAKDQLNVKDFWEMRAKAQHFRALMFRVSLRLSHILTKTVVWKRYFKYSSQLDNFLFNCLFVTSVS